MARLLERLETNRGEPLARARGIDDVVELAASGAELVADPALLLVAERLGRHEPVDVGAIADIGGHAAR